MGVSAEETNRLNRERRSNGDSWKVELERTGLDARREELTALFADAPADTPDILSSVSAIQAKKVLL